MNKPYKYGVAPSDPEYHKKLSAIRNRRRTYDDQYEKWDSIVQFVTECIELKGMTHEEIVKEITNTTPYKIIKRSKEINYDK